MRHAAKLVTSLSGSWTQDSETTFYAPWLGRVGWVLHPLSVGEGANFAHLWGELVAGAPQAASPG